MKKILLSVIALFAAISMNAKEDVDISSIGGVNTPIKFAGTWEWKGQVISTGSNVVDEAAGTVDDSGVTYFDASAYDYLFFKYTSNSDKVKCIIQYNTTGEIGQWGPNYYESTVELKASENIGYIPLLEDNKGTISQVAFQDMGEAVELTITEIWFGTEAEVEAALGGGETPEPAPTPAPAGDVAAYALNVDNALGLDADNGSTLTAGTELYSGEEGVLTIGADDTYKPHEVEFNAGADLKGGLQGGTNPKDEDSDVPDKTLKAPVSGAFFVWEAKQDGFLYAISKVSSHKSYTVFEEGTAIGYKYGAQGDASTKLGATYQFELKGEGEYNERKEAIEWAEQEYLKVADPDFYASNWEDKTADDGTVSKSWIKIGVDGLGVIVIPVVKDCKYIFNACGSKLRLGGIAFSAADDLTIKTTDGVTVYTGGGETAIQGAKVVTVNANGAIYNLAGQKVGASYKGIVIKDGKKFIQK